MTLSPSDPSSERSREVRPGESLARTTSRAVLWNIVLVPLLAALSLSSSALVARALSIEEYRVYGLAIAAIASLLLWSDLGISSSVARFTPEVSKLGAEATARYLGGAAKLRMVAVGVLVVLLVAGRYRFPSWNRVLPFEGWSLLLIAAAVMLQSLARIYQYFLTGLFDRKTIGVILLVATGAQSAFVISAALVGAGVAGILAAITLAALIELELSRFTSKRRGAFAVQGSDLPLPRDLVGDTTRFASVSFLEKLLSYMNSPFFVVFLIAALGAPEAVAYFTVAAEFCMRVVSMLSIPFSGITLPLFSSVDARNDSREAASVLRLYLMLMILLFTPTAALLTSVAPSLLPLLYGARYEQAVPVLQLFVPFLFLEYTVYSALLAALMTRRRYKEVLTAKIPLLAGVPAVSLAIPHWGAAGAVVAFGVARLLSAAWLLRAGIRELEFRFPAGFALKVVAASVGAAFPVVLAGHALPSGWASLALLLALGLASFLVLYKLLGGMGPEDRSRLSSGIPSQLAWLSHLL